jgi:hypothetical protein
VPGSTPGRPTKLSITYNDHRTRTSVRGTLVGQLGDNFAASGYWRTARAAFAGAGTRYHDFWLSLTGAAVKRHSPLWARSARSRIGQIRSLTRATRFAAKPTSEFAPKPATRLDDYRVRLAWSSQSGSTRLVTLRNPRRNHIELSRVPCGPAAQPRRESTESRVGVRPGSCHSVAPPKARQGRHRGWPRDLPLRPRDYQTAVMASAREVGAIPLANWGRLPLNVRMATEGVSTVDNTPVGQLRREPKV